MTKLRLFGISFLIAFACTQQSEIGSMEGEELTVNQNQVASEQDDLADTKRRIGQMIDPTYSDVSDFNQRFDSYMISADGEIEEVSHATAIDLFLQILDSKNNDFDKAPMFEVKNSEQVVLLLKGNGVAANMLIDRQNISILHIMLIPGSKANDLEENAEAFQKQFAGTKIDFSENNYGLKPWDKEKGPEHVQVDGISGATDVCQLTIDMLNNELKKYQKYFNKIDGS